VGQGGDGRHGVAVLTAAPSGKVGPIERHGEEETQRRDRTVDARRLHAGLRLVQLETAQILRRRRVGRPADEGCERPHVANVVAARLLGEAATLMSSSLSVLLIVTFRPSSSRPGLVEAILQGRQSVELTATRAD